jgi:crotonobetaine/carnitine-CoA ligase
MSRPAIVDLILERREQHPEQVYLRFGDQDVTWAEFADSMWRAANRLRTVGVEPGDRVALMLPNSPEFLFAYFGALAAGAATVPVNTAQRGAALEHIVRDSGSVAIVVDESLRRFVVDGPTVVDRPTLCDGEPAEFSLPPDARSGLGILYTSGTTGPPKGVVAEKYDLSLIQGLLDLLEVSPGETVYTALPLFHGNALILSAMGSIWNDWTLALAERFSASRFWDEVRAAGAVAFTSLGAMIPILLKQPPRPRDRANPARVCLSAACPEWAWEEFERRFGLRLIEFYGLVDHPGYLVNSEGRVGSMGKPFGPTEFRVDEDGELLLRDSRGRLTHYHNRPDATEEAYRGGWFHTGDLARIDEEGFYYYLGRKKESIRRRGENISAWEIETAVNRHPAVQESAAHAVTSELGEDEVKLVVVRRPGAELTPEDLIEFCEGKVADYAIPSYIEFRDALPKTGTHRIQYAALKAEGITPATWERPLQRR